LQHNIQKYIIKDDNFVKKTALNWMKNQKFKIPYKYAKFEPL
jgi:hypothetical protein